MINSYTENAGVAGQNNKQVAAYADLGEAGSDSYSYMHAHIAYTTYYIPVYYVPYTMHSVLYTVDCILYTMCDILSTIYYVLYTVFYTQCTVYCLLDSIIYTTHYIRYTIYYMLRRPCSGAQSGHHLQAQVRRWRSGCCKGGSKW